MAYITIRDSLNISNFNSNIVPGNEYFVFIRAIIASGSDGEVLIYQINNMGTVLSKESVDTPDEGLFDAGYHIIAVPGAVKLTVEFKSAIVLNISLYSDNLLIGGQFTIVNGDNGLFSIKNVKNGHFNVPFNEERGVFV